MSDAGTSKPWTRRQWLAAMATLGIGSAAGIWAWNRKGKPGYSIILDNPNATLGHRLRDGWQPPAATRTRKQGIVIIGGGMSGLSAAWWLKRSGYHDFELLELEANVGGNSSGGGNAVSGFPWAAHYVPVLNEETQYAQLLFRELGIITGDDPTGRPIYDELALVHDPDERLFQFGTWHEGLFPRTGLTPDDKAQAARFFQQMEAYRQLRVDGKHAFSIPHALSGWNDELRALEAMSFSTWLDQQGYTSQPLLWYLDYATRDDYGLTPAKTSAWAGIHYFAGRRGIAANADREAVLTWPNGNQHLVQLLSAKLQAYLRTQQLVTKLTQSPTGIVVEVYDAATDTSERIEAQGVVLAVPMYVAARLAPWLGLDASPFVHTPWVVCNVTLRDLPTGLGVPLAWDNVSRHSNSLGYIHAKHQHVGRSTTNTVLTWYQPLTSTNINPDAIATRRDAYRQPAEHWAEMCLEDLSRMHPGIREQVAEVRIRLWGHGMVGPTPGLLHHPARQQAAQGFADGRLRLAHTDIAGISIFEEAQYQGITAAQALLSRV